METKIYALTRHWEPTYSLTISGFKAMRNIFLVVMNVTLSMIFCDIWFNGDKILHIYHHIKARWGNSVEREGSQIQTKESETTPLSLLGNS